VNEQVQKAVRHPIWTVGTIISVVLLFAGGLSTANELENQVNNNTNLIEHNDEKSEIFDEHLSKTLSDIQQGQKETQQLLNQLILQGG